MYLLSAAVGSSILYCYYFHNSLASKLHPSSHHGTLPSSVADIITSIPEEVYTDKYYSLYDHVSRPVSRRLLPPWDSSRLLTVLLRRNMTLFSRFPQAFMLRFVSGNSQSFQAQHIQSLDFNEGDIVCGMYKVKVRTATKIEFEMLPMGIVNGRLVVSLEERDGDVVFSNDTVMWKDKEEQGKLPLERTVLRFVHEMTAWWLIDSGVRYLMDLEGPLMEEE